MTKIGKNKKNHAPFLKQTLGKIETFLLEFFIK